MDSFYGEQSGELEDVPKSTQASDGKASRLKPQKLGWIEHTYLSI